MVIKYHILLSGAMENPQDVLAIDEIKMLTGYNVRAVVCSPKDIEFGLQQYPAEDEGIITAGPAISKTRHALQTLLFFFLLLLPLGIVYYVAAYVSNDFNYWLLGNNDITNIITVLIIWMFYAVILFYIFGLIFEQPAPRKDRKTSSE